MEINAQAISHLKQNNIYFKVIKFKRSASEPDQISAVFNAKYKYLSKKAVAIELSTKISSDNGMQIDIILHGEYELDNCESLGDNYIKEILENNTVAIMFPYLRAEISLITAQPGMAPIILPALNINELLKDNKIYDN